MLITNIKQDANNPPKPRSIHVYLLRYTDRVFILKYVASKLKVNKYKHTQLFISDDVSMAVRKEREKLRKDYPPAVKAKTNAQFTFIPFSVPARVLHKGDGTEKWKLASLCYI